MFEYTKLVEETLENQILFKMSDNLSLDTYHNFSLSYHNLKLKENG